MLHVSICLRARLQTSRGKVSMLSKNALKYVFGVQVQEQLLRLSGLSSGGEPTTHMIIAIQNQSFSFVGGVIRSIFRFFN